MSRLDALINSKSSPRSFKKAFYLPDQDPLCSFRLLSSESRIEQQCHLAAELGDVLQAYLGYIACLVFGTRQEKKTLLGLLNHGKPPLRGFKNLSSHRPVQLWVGATLYATATDFCQWVYVRVNYRTAEEAYAEFTTLVYSMGLPPGTWPENQQAFWRYWDDQIEQLAVTADARQFA
ncbi:hypothetical protein BDV28DRAFT_149408 [Aspergillus coremiiformis]|uniref:ER-bound oxygenase mpaB/mpaB'/Rubber oxygenase catalytic domain-containing protein n=1 Tax=Aspergillus coremiiformis TaxID=138285 RepID=A0A5N6Z2Z5_9EURO|nr:hypothetical protein BDV28DRAFT_149408 [Aspergillus coremiiformis]